MGVDPSEYDVAELREVAGEEPEDPVETVEYDVLEHGFHWASASEGRPPPVDNPTPEQRARLLELEGVDAEEVGDRPYLERLPEGDRARALVLDWLTYLADEAGHEGARAVLGRYRELGWFTGTVEERLRGYMLGVGRPEGEGTAALDRTDHLVSFVYVVKLSTLARDRRPPARDGDERRDRHGDGDRSPQDRP